VARVVDGITTTHYVYDTQYRVLEERDEGGALLARYTYGTGMDEPLTMERDGNTYYYHRDALGSITEITDESGTLVERYEYDVYGAVTIYDSSDVTITTSAIGNPYLFTARRYDPESNNYYYRARYYSPALGRFLSQDPLGFDAGDYNLYRYAFNNPTNLTDPSGEIITPDTVLDIIFIAYDAVMIVTDFYRLFFDDECDKGEIWRALGIDFLALGFDFLCALVPVATGGGPGLRLAAASAHGGSVAVDAVRVAHVAEELLRRGTQIAVKGVQIGNNVWLSKATDGSGGSGEGGRPRNQDGIPYPRHTVKGYGEVPFPSGEIKVTDPKPLRKQFRGIKVEFRKWWYNKYGWFPSPDIYDIHHVKPLSRGGTNDFDNLVPVKKGPDHNQFTTWWKKYP
jgi:RHS repeat-associated protein